MKICAVFDVQICTQKKTILSVEDIIALIGDKCDGVIGQVGKQSEMEFLLFFFFFSFPFWCEFWLLMKWVVVVLLAFLWVS